MDAKITKTNNTGIDDQNKSSLALTLYCTWNYSKEPQD